MGARRWRWIEISPAPIQLPERGKIYIGRAERNTRFITGRGPAFSRRDTLEFISRRLTRAQLVLHLGSQGVSGRMGIGGRLRLPEISFSASVFFVGGLALTLLGRPRRGALRSQGRSSRSIPPLPSPASARLDLRSAMIRYTLLQLEPLISRGPGGGGAGGMKQA